MIPRCIGLQGAVTALAANQVIAYPTEAVFGLGGCCHPKAIARLQALKPRENKGWIALIPDWASVAHWVSPLSGPAQARLETHWPGPTTFVCPASDQAPPELVIEGRIALRLSAHPIVCALMDRWGQALLSTSANPPGQAPARFTQQVMDYFPEISGIVPGMVDLNQQPTQIIDVLTGECLRKS